MRIDRLSTENLREGVFCAAGNPHGEEAYNQLEAWLEGEQLRGQIAREDNGDVAGFVLYYPIEHAPLDVDGEGIYVVQCLFVKPDYQHKGIGRALITTALADARDCGASGVAVEGFHRADAPELKPGAFFGHIGMSAVDTRDSGTLYFVSFDQSAKPPRYLQPDADKLKSTPKLKIDILDCRRCYVGISNRELVKTVLEGIDNDNIELEIHDQNSRQAILDKGMSSGIFIDGKLSFFGKRLNEEDVWRAIEVAMSARDQAIDR